MVTEKQMQDESHIRRVLSKTDANTIASLTAEVERQYVRRLAAEAQVEKLRAALEITLGHLTCGMDGNWADCDPAEVARAALQSTEGDGR